MARKLALRKVQIKTPLAPPEAPAQTFDYGATLLLILQHSPPNRGVTLDETIRVLEAVGPIEQAIEAEAGEVVLSETQYAVLREKLDAFQFGFVHRAIAEFGLMVRNTPEIGTETPSKKVAA